MAQLSFDDGMNIETGGKLRVIKKPDGFYVIGDGNLIPVDSRADGEQLIKEMQ